MPTPLSSTARRAAASSFPVDDPESQPPPPEASKLWNALRHVAIPASKQAVNRQIVSTVAGVDCPAHSAVTVAVGRYGQRNAAIHANTINLNSQRFKSAASVPVKVGPTAQAGQSPQEFDLCENFLAQSLISGQGLFQFVSPRANKNTLETDAARSKEAPIITQLAHRWNRCRKINENLVLAERFEVVAVEQKKLLGNELSNDHCCCELTAIDLTDGTQKKVMVTQAGLSFTDKVLHADEIERANDLMNLQMLEQRTLQENSAVSASSAQTDPLIVSYAGIGRNATLITYREALARIKAEPHEKTLDENWLNETLFNIVRAGREDRGRHFIHSDAQLQALHASLMRKIEYRAAPVSPRSQQRDRVVRLAMASGAMSRSIAWIPWSQPPAASDVDNQSEDSDTSDVGDVAVFGNTTHANCAEDATEPRHDSDTIDRDGMNEAAHGDDSGASKNATTATDSLPTNPQQLIQSDTPPANDSVRDTLKKEWGTWAAQAPTENALEYKTAVERMDRWIDQPDPDIRLELDNLHLGSLPKNLPPGLRYLDISNNALFELPAELPPTLKTLNTSNNHLTSLPDSLPASIEAINANVNQIRKLPERLPGKLTSLELHSNLMSDIPTTLPDSIKKLTLSGNDLHGLPSKLPNSLTQLFAASNEIRVIQENLPPNLEVLDLADNLINTLPENLPATITRLAVDGNQLTTLPDRLPENLLELSAYNNHIVTLPITLPPRLKRLLLPANELTGLPERLPVNLEEINLSNNRLTGLTSLAGLQALRKLNLTNNRLTNLPDNILHLPQTCEIELETDSLSNGVYNRLVAVCNTPNFAGPRIHLQMRAPPENLQIQPLHIEVGSWREGLAGGLAAQQNVVWSQNLNRENVQAFSHFLAKVRQTSDYTNATTTLATIERVNSLLDQIALNTELRENCFNLALDATATCTDRTALRLMDMEILCLLARASDDIDEGKFDHAPGALIDLCKGLYRLQILTNEAKAKIATLHLTDAIEVHLGYILNCTEEFNLPVNTRSMFFPRLSDLTEEDIVNAKRKLSSDGLSTEEKKASDTGFHLFLATAPLVIKLLERVAPNRMNTAAEDARKLRATRGEDLQNRMAALDPDAPDYLRRAQELGEEFKRMESEAPGGVVLPMLLEFLKQTGTSATF